MGTSLNDKNNSGAIIGDPFTFVLKISFLMFAAAQSMGFCIKKTCAAAHYHHGILFIYRTVSERRGADASMAGDWAGGHQAPAAPGPEA